jgi:hypothetical protein
MQVGAQRHQPYWNEDEGFWSCIKDGCEWTHVPEGDAYLPPGPEQGGVPTPMGPDTEANMHYWEFPG